jgi:hypothetical protein
VAFGHLAELTFDYALGHSTFRDFYLPTPKFNLGKSSFLRKFITLELYKTPIEFKDWANATYFTGSDGG